MRVPSLYDLDTRVTSLELKKNGKVVASRQARRAFTQSIFIPASAMRALSATEDASGLAGVLTCSASATQGGTFTWEVPPDWKTGVVTVLLHFVKSASGSGNIVHRLNTLQLVAGGDISAAGANTDQTVAVPATAALLAVLTLGTFAPAAGGEIWRIAAERVGGDAADTYASTSQIVGIELQYSAQT